MHRSYCFNGFQFKHYGSGHQDVDSIATFEFNAFINNRNSNLPPKLKFSDA